jgi:fibronectin-binding autotransporter adhesin
VSNLAMIRTFDHDVVSGNKAGIGAGITTLGTIIKLSNSTISHNHLTANGAGGGIANAFGTVTMVDDTVSHNTATGGPQASGGGIDNSGRLTLIGSVVTGNVATALGGGIRNDERALPHFLLSIKSSKVTDNAVTSTHGLAGGGGTYNDGAMTLAGTEVRGNKAVEGGGLYVDLESKKTALENSVIRDNQAKATEAASSSPAARR